MIEKIITRAEAKTAGLDHYFTGASCVRGHIAKRRTVNGSCHQCFLDDKQAKRSQKPGYRTRADMDAERMQPMRKCSACGNEFPANDEFFQPLRKKQPSGTITTGLSRECRECRNKRYKPFYEGHRAELIERATEYHRKRREQPELRERERGFDRERMRRKLADPIKREKHNELGRFWRAANPEKVRQFKHEQPPMKAYRTMLAYARELKTVPSWLSKEDKERIKTIYAIADFLTKKTGIPHDVDHIYPLVHPLCCGLHLPWNLRVVTRTYNKRKGSKLPDELPPSELPPISDYARDLISQQLTRAR